MKSQTLASDRHTLHVLRHPPTTNERAGEAHEGPRGHGVLWEGLERADREHWNVLREVKEEFYYGVATPSVLRIDQRVADRLRISLRLKETVFGVWGPVRIRRGDAVYSIWIQYQLCG
ncbi:MAG: hypothetical protein V3U17_03095 [Thermoplasmata archaeon]